MESSTLQSHLVDEAARLKAAVVAAGPKTPVPSCPGWNATDLLDHVTDVYDHKIQCMRLLRAPEDHERLVRHGSPTERFDASLAELLGEFDARGPGSLAYTWYGPDQTVGFWIRRLACETLVHRADAELAAGETIGEVDEAFGIDAVDEILAVMLAWGSRAYREWVADALRGHAGLAVAIDARARSWTVRVEPEHIDLEAEIGDDAQATVSGTPREILMWLWRRLPAEAVAVQGDQAKAAELHEMIGLFTQ